MKAETLFAEMAERYRAAPDHPFSRFPEYAVFRHSGNRKWFGVYLPVPAEKLRAAPQNFYRVILQNEYEKLSIKFSTVAASAT